MRYAIIVTVLSLVLGASFAEPQSSDPNMKNEAKPQSKKISVADFGNKNVIGHLGHPLGTVVHVTGIAVDGKTTRMKRDMGKTLLEIHTVNGEKLKTKASFEFRRAPKSLAKPEPGTKFEYYVHEYGAFDGVVVPPKELGIESPMVAHDGFYYRHRITIHKSLK